MASGGAREGAGRKKLDASKKKLNKTFRIDPQLFKEIELKYPNEKLTTIIEKALIEYLKKN
nr:MAG TPA: antitoxin [Caudoviricetes sp.]DAM42667.1 MAG TPA: antitoxin [Caudoviricetes sp.]